MKSRLEQELSHELHDYSDITFSPQPLDLGKRVSKAHTRRRVGQAAVGVLALTGVLAGGTFAYQNLPNRNETVAAPAATGQGKAGPTAGIDKYELARWNRLSTSEMRDFSEAQFKLESDCLRAKGFKHHRVDLHQMFFETYDVVDGKTVLLRGEADGQVMDKQAKVNKADRAPATAIEGTTDGLVPNPDTCRGGAFVRLFGDFKTAEAASNFYSSDRADGSTIGTEEEQKKAHAISLRAHDAALACMKRRGLLDDWQSKDPVRTEKVRPMLYVCYAEPDAKQAFSDSALATAEIVHRVSPETVAEADRIKRLVIKNAAEVLATK